jgi:RNA polymerase sigma factor (sigma-70 family)
MNIVLEEQISTKEETPLESLETGELFNLLEQIRLELPERTARYIDEYYLEGLTHRHIAERHGVSVHTVSGNIRRGLRVLREKLENNIIFTDDFPFRMRIR